MLSSTGHVNFRNPISSAGYQGNYAEKEETGSTNAFKLRRWDSRIGRWMSPDPYGQYHSPYLGMGNNPISNVDPDGGFETRFGAWLYRLFSGADGEIFETNYGDWGISQTYFDEKAGVNGIKMTFGWEWEKNNIGNAMPWMDLAIGEIGVKETFEKLGHNNPRVMEYLKTTGSWWKNDKTPWCSGFCNWTMNESGYSGTNSAKARSWNKWQGGERHDKPLLGSIVVFGYREGAGHVGFVVGKTQNRLVVLGGNQGSKGNGRVKLSAFNKGKVIGYIVAKGHQLKHSLLNLKSNYKTLNYDSTR